jgi:hypothetical protein
MGKGAAGAMALVLLWLAFASFFVAFHPGGLILQSGQPAKNPRDVIIWFMERISVGPSLSQQTATSAAAGAADAAGEATAGAAALWLSWL